MHTTIENPWGRGWASRARAASLLVALAAFSACSDDTPTTPPGPVVAYLEISPEDLLLAPGDTATLTAKLFASDGTEITGRAVSWASSASQFATVDIHGRVRAIAPGGPVLVTATSGGTTGPAFVVVAAANPVPVAQRLLPAALSAGSGPATIRVVGQGFMQGAEARWNGSLRPTTWIAADSLDIELTADDLAQAGQGQVRVFNPSPGGGLSAALALQITAAQIAMVELGDFAREIDAGQAIPLSARGLDPMGRPVEGGPVQWSSSVESVASVTPSGVLMAHQWGRTTVRAEIGGRYAEAEILVRVGNEPVAYVFVEPHDVVTLVGHGSSLSTLVISTSGAEIVGRPTTWTSLDPSIVTVDSQGMIRALRKGTTWVRATVGGVEGSARVEVRQYPDEPLHTYDLRIDPSIVLREVGDTTWTIDGVTHAATLHLFGATLEVDRSNHTYRLVWRLQVAVNGPGFVGSTTRVETGAAVRYTRSATDYGYTVTPAGGTAFEVPAGFGDLTMTRSLGLIAPYPFYFVIR